MDIGGMPLAVWVLRRCTLVRTAHMTALVTSIHPTDDALSEAVMQAGFPCFRGSLENVRQRYIAAGQHFQLDVVGRVCGDSPFVDVDMLDTLLHAAQVGKADYLRVVDTVPGFVSEAFTLRALESSQGLEPQAVEHVTTALRQHPTRYTHLLVPGIPAPQAIPPLTIDTAPDIMLTRALVAKGCTFDTLAEDVLRRLNSVMQNTLRSRVSE